MTDRILITGGAGFIGSAVIRYLLANTQCHVLNVDKLTYAGHPASIPGAHDYPDYAFELLDICDRGALRAAFRRFRPSAVLHLAAETHVDRSIDDPLVFINSNIVGTANLLEVAREYWSALNVNEQQTFRFHHVSTDEVYGDLAEDTAPADESAPYRPGSPYSASKAAADHLVRAWHRTWGLPVIISSSVNNYGPFQFPEKLIPHMILNALAGQSLPVYGNGEQLREWLHVDDHARMLHGVLLRGRVGETYNIGGGAAQRNLAVVEAVCALLDELAPALRAGIGSYRELITFVADRPGHDRRYASNAGKLATELNLTPQTEFTDGLRQTVQWYLSNEWWWQPLLEGGYRLGRLGHSMPGR